MNGIKLKKCPFCGGEGRIFIGNGGVSVYCTNCGITTPTYVDSATTTSSYALGNAVGIWNNRRKIKKDEVPFN